MAIEAKATLLNEMERALATEVTAAELTRILTILTEKLDHYDLTMTALDGPQQDDLLDAYLSALAIEGRSKKTIERYRYLISRMMDAVRTPTRKITVYHLRKYLADEKARGISDRTLESTRQVFSAYFNWLQRERLIDQNPVGNLGVIKYQKKEKDVYSEVDIERMKFGCKSLRDRVIVTFLQATGCRISEMVGLNRDDVDLKSLECKVLGKGNKERTVFLDQVAAATLQAYLATRTDELPALFVGKGTERLHPGGVRKMLCDLGASAHVSHVHPHKFRRTTATNLIRHGMPIQEVAAILGHDKLYTTMQYVVLDKSDIKSSYRKYA
jgi:site-specific recombinase XerD